MNASEERVYGRADVAVGLAAEIYDALSLIRYDPVGAMPGDGDRMVEIISLLRRALEKAEKVKDHTGKG